MLDALSFMPALFLCESLRQPSLGFPLLAGRDPVLCLSGFLYSSIL